MAISDNHTDVMGYCPRCGRITFYLEPYRCGFCDFQLQPTKYTLAEFWEADDDEAFMEAIRKEYVENNPLFDQNEADRQDRLIKKQNDEYNRRKAQQIINESNAVTCPYCKSTNVSKIGMISRAISVDLFGLASSKIGKQYHCNNCKADF